ncbi:MAG: hypothetical protein E5X43_05260 [Mesorhizobium sp.]|nr:MAG: hypothetical protein E5X43_05260 [Mesorhizobium sp.]
MPISATACFTRLSRRRPHEPAPLWPALFAKTWHLPLKGGDQALSRTSPIANVSRWMPAPRLPISPLEGEMPGRAEGGAWLPLCRCFLTVPGPCQESR